MRLTLVLILMFAVAAVFGQNAEDKISQVLLDRLADEPNDAQSIIIILSDQVDLYPMDNAFRINRPSQKERIAQLIPLLKSKAQESQEGLLRFLEEEGVNKSNLNSFWIHSMLAFEAKEALIRKIAIREEVDYIKWDAPTYVDEHLSNAESEALLPIMVAEDQPEQGLLAIKADKLWEMGYTGYGAIALGADTGIEAFHPAYNNRWMGFYKDQSQAWFNYNNSNQTLPFDCGDHGMHTLGTMLGISHLSNDTIGVAPQANWIGSPVLCGGGTTSNIAAFQFSLDPDDDINTVDDMPIVVNNSWWDPSQQGIDCNSEYVAILMACEMAGVAVVFSNGNGGPEPATTTPPKNINVTEINSFCVGNLNGNLGNLPITNSSSRGPSTCGGDSSILIKPEVSAPGTNVRSCSLDRTYDNKTGTSMAAPHVAGAILLLKEAFPTLLSEDFKLALYLSARDLGAPGEDNDYGMGIIDVKAAFDYLLDQGHTPVIPDKNLDLVGVDVDAQIDYCGEEFSFGFYVTNDGQDEITKFDYAVTVRGINGNEIWSNTDTWNGNLSKGEIEYITMNVNGISNGEYVLVVNTSNPNDLTDPRPFNNAVGKLISIDTEREVALKINGVTDGTACENSIVTLTAELGNNENYFVRWFEDYANESLIGTGKSISIDLEDEPKEIFAQPFLTQTGGADIPASGEYTVGNGLKFRVLSASEIIRSVDIFVEETGNRIFQIRDGDTGASLINRQIEVNNIGANTIFLDLTLEAGFYEMTFIINNPMLEKAADVSYPYLVGNTVRIEGAKTPDTYPYFFNWKLERPYGCPNQRILVEPAGTLDMTLAFDLSAAMLFVGEELTVTNNTEGAVRYDWLVNELLSFEDVESPDFIFDMPGTYEITQIATNAEGCQSTLTQTVVVDIASTVYHPGTEFDCRLFPNPATREFFVEFASPANIKSTFLLRDNLGRIMPNLNQKTNGNANFRVGIESLSAGLYFLEIRMEGRPSWIHKLVVQ